jgi:peroxiredoxin Q/BCP
MSFQSLLFIIPLVLFNSLFALKVDEKVPIFQAVDSKGSNWNSQSFLGQKYLLIYFYPAAMTGGCTKQACAYRNDYKKWKKNDVEIVAVSGDMPNNLALFKQAENLPFTLLSDPEGKVARIFNVPTTSGGVIEKLFKGEKFKLERGVTTKRWTFLLSKNGKLIYKNDKVDASKDSEIVMKFLTNKNNGSE